MEHKDHEPHNAQSLYYQYRFYFLRHRWPTWADAVAHCTPEMQRHWKQALEARDAWTEPSDHERPIGDPVNESLSQVVQFEQIESVMREEIADENRSV
jgi:hypothetical protein